MKNETILKLQQKFKSEAHNEFTEKVNQITTTATNCKRLQTDVGLILYPYGRRFRRVCKS